MLCFKASKLENHPTWQDIFNDFWKSQFCNMLHYSMLTNRGKCHACSRNWDISWPNRHLMSCWDFIKLRRLPFSSWVSVYGLIRKFNSGSSQNAPRGAIKVRRWGACTSVLKMHWLSVLSIYFKLIRKNVAYLCYCRWSKMLESSFFIEGTPVSTLLFV